MMVCRDFGTTKKVAGFDAPRHAQRTGSRTHTKATEQGRQPKKTQFGWFSFTILRVRTAAMLGECVWAAVLLPVIMAVLS